MTLIRTGGGVTDIRGGFSGVYFHRDKSGLHCCSKPRTVYRRSAAQDLQRDAFRAARRYSTDNRTVSYLMYRYMNGLPFLFDAIVTGDPSPDCTGKYELAGTHEKENYYQRTDGAWTLWWNGTDKWIISLGIEDIFLGSWFNPTKNIEGLYRFFGEYSGMATVNLRLLPPPLDYYIPKL